MTATLGAGGASSTYHSENILGGEGGPSHYPSLEVTSKEDSTPAENHFSSYERKQEQPSQGPFGEFFFGIVNLFAGCSPLRPTQAKNVDIKLLPNGVKKKVRLDLNGDPKLGWIVFYRDFHYDKTFDNNPEALDAILKTQWEMLKDLEARKIKHIFKEGYASDSPEGITKKEMIQKEGLLDFYHKLRKLFGGQLPDHLAELGSLRSRALMEFGAYYVYSIRHEDVRIHRISTLKEIEETEKARACFIETDAICLEDALQGLSLSEWQERRNGFAYREIRRFLENHLGKEVALIFGAYHNFHDNFIAGGFKPVIESILFEIPDSISIDFPPLDEGGNY